MPEFRYKARDSRNKLKIGSLKASSKMQARAHLRRMRYNVISINIIKLDDKKNIPLSGFVYKDSKGNIKFDLGEKYPTTKDIVIFTKQFATLINSGVPLIQSLAILASQQRVRNFGLILERIRAAVENGATLSEGLEAFPKIFDNLYVALVRAAEVSGSLDTILLKLVSYIEKSAKIKSQIKTASFYPTAVMVIAVLVVSGLLVFVVPTFVKQFSSSGAPLPFLTQVIVNMSDFLVGSWYILLASLLASFFAFKYALRTEKGRVWWDDFVLKVPGFGDLFRKVAIGRFCSTMSTMLNSGVNLLEALTICASSSGNKTIERFILGVREKVEQGSKLSEPLSQGNIFPQMVVSMVSVGESTGAIDEMLLKISSFYEEEVDLAVKGILSMIEPILLVVVGGIVGFIVIALYLPIFDMAGTMGG